MEDRKKRIAQLQAIKPLAIVPFGSFVYGTNIKSSDDDLVVIVSDDLSKTTNELGGLFADAQFFRVSDFQSMLLKNEICAMECYFSSSTIQGLFSFQLNLGNLRAEISKVSNNSWVKGNKKLTVTSDYSKKLAVKSIFHSIRILDFGIQLAQFGKIREFDSMNWLFHDLLKVSRNVEGEALWKLIKNKYQNLFQTKGKEFRKLAPKNSKEKNLREYLQAIKKNTEGLEDAYSVGKREIVLTILQEYL